ncbi:MFS transporter [Paenibacillus sp. GP183]|uniref:MDR family MFS transporter n=1 Tax=Paenibacillus sp. GP183 TaxID=1882751 RepID=UPI0008943486|nr:MFS transporter [Paenibacillus sp. GP183]SEC63449.1 Predicted arabinose efflux permease, MFS family [Paenibacillus sp. GP183]
MRRIPFFSMLIGYDTAIWIRVIGTILISLTGFMMRPYLVYYLYDKLDGSIILSMIIVGVQPLCGMIVNLYAGGLSDRYGRKPMMLISLLVQGLSIAGYIGATEVWHYAVISVFNGIGFALFMPAANAQITDVVPAEKRAEVFALLHTALNMGAAFGPVVGLLLFNWNQSLIFLVCSLSLFVYATLVGWKVPETLPVRSKVQQAAFLKKPKVKWSEHKTLLWMTLLTMPATLLYAQVESTFPLHLQHHFENYKSVFATIVTFNGLMVITLQLWIAKRTEAKPAYLMIGLAYLLFAIVALGYGYMPYLALLLVVEFLFTVGEMLYGPHAQKVISIIAPEDQRGWYFSVYGMNWQLARAFGPIIGGFLLSRFGGEFMFTVLAAVILIAGIAQTSLIKRLNPHKEKVVTEEQIVV